MEQLQAAGAHLETSNDVAICYIGHLLQTLNPSPEGDLESKTPDPKSIDISVLQAPFAAINVGLESFAASLRAQGSPVTQVDWRPPAGGNEHLMAILERMKRK